MDSRREAWLDQALAQHQRLTGVVVSLVESLLRSEGVDFLAVSGRTKTKKSAAEKIDRKGYRDPGAQLTDLSGIRIIVYFESQIEKVSEVIARSFSVDEANSLNRDALLSVNQTGYRSVHFVCDLGVARAVLPEFKGLGGLKFEFQVRTVLQHAWAELAHDRNYKFSGVLPREMERKLYLYAGMLEIADKGFDELSKQIDDYVDQLQKKSNSGDLTSKIDSISLEQFVDGWSRKNKFDLEVPVKSMDIGELVLELRQFGVDTLDSLQEIIPHDYAERASEIDYTTTIYGLVRDWMLIHDWKRFVRDVKFNWALSGEEEDGMLGAYLGDEYRELRKKTWHNVER